METANGIHAAITSILGVLILYFSYNWVTTFFSTITDTLILSIFWGGFILLGLINIIVVPILIATSEEGSQSVVWAAASWFWFYIMIFFNRLLFPVIDQFISFQTDTFSIQILSWFYLIAIVFTIMVIPFVASLAPDMIEGVINDD